LGVTYVGQTTGFSWEAQSKYKLRFKNNSEGYRLGNQFSAVSWAAIVLNQNFSVSTSLRYTHLGSIKGQDTDINPMMMPLFHISNSGRNQVDIGFGVNFFIPNGAFKNLRLAVETQLPILQKANGIQMKNTSLATFGIQYAL
jgi:hypothetical protein